MPLALLALAIGAFGIGTTEFVIMGVLPQVAEDFGVTIPTAVWLVSGIVTLYTAVASKDMPHRGIVMAVAALGIVAGVVVLALPTESARALTRLLGLWLVLMGLAETAVALAWRSALRRAGITGHDVSGPATCVKTPTATRRTT